ncbi:hypothetical protein EDB85DRAFT_2296635 [Lactarius pseudohatsudake]|nr:hypothetical protein EDB85DRAFT_2296635 [Lactarius pseudohatsudake]
MEAQDRYIPPFRPRPRSRRTGDPNTTLAPADSRAGAAQEEGARPPHSRAMGARQVSPPSLIREQDTRDKPPQPPLPFARKGSARNEVRHGTGHATRDGVGEGTRNTPSPLSPGTACATPEGTRRPPSRFARRGDTQTRGARGNENGRASTPLAPRRRLHAGSARMGGALQPGAAPPSPRVGARGQRANRNAQKRRPSPGTPLPAGSCARARTGDHAEAPPLPPPREPGSPPVCTPGVQRAGWCTTGRRANREARPGGPPSFAHRSDTHTRAALVCKAE